MKWLNGTFDVICFFHHNNIFFFLKEKKGASIGKRAEKHWVRTGCWGGRWSPPGDEAGKVNKARPPKSWLSCSVDRFQSDGCAVGKRFL